MRDPLRPLAVEIAKAIRTDHRHLPYVTDSLTADLKRWQTKSLKALKDGRRAQVSFSSDTIPDTLTKAIRGHLSDAVTPEQVRAAFRSSASSSPPPTTHTTATVVAGTAAVGFQAEFDKLTVEFTAELTEFAGQLGSGAITADIFRDRMAAAIQATYQRAYELGASVQQLGLASLSAADKATITDYIHDELEYLNGFERALALQHVPDSEAYLIGRVTLYADAVYGLYWEGRTSRVSDDFDVYYQSEDDTNTCLPCQLNEVRSPYSPEDAPIPGNDCEGRSRCRCTLRYVARQEMQIAASARVDLAKQVEASRIPDAFLQLAKQPTVLLVRHGDTKLNEQDRIRAWEDPPLNAAGRKGAHDLADEMAAIKEQKGHDVRRLVSSDLTRAMQTAEPISKALKTKIEPMRELRPWNVGDYGGQRVADVLGKLNRLQTTARDEQPPGDGESFNEFLERFLPALENLMQDALDYPDDFTVAVCHTRNQRSAIGWLAAGMDGIEVNEEPLLTEDELAPGGFLAIAHDGKKWEIVEKFKARKAQDEE